MMINEANDKWILPEIDNGVMKQICNLVLIVVRGSLCRLITLFLRTYPGQTVPFSPDGLMDPVLEDLLWSGVHFYGLVLNDSPWLGGPVFV